MTPCAEGLSAKTRLGCWVGNTCINLQIMQQVGLTRWGWQRKKLQKILNVRNLKANAQMRIVHRHMKKQEIKL